jgi:hypothetical protein
MRPDLLSSCCGAPLVVAGRGTTHWYVCTACQKPADFSTSDRLPVAAGHPVACR